MTDVFTTYSTEADLFAGLAETGQSIAQLWTNACCAAIAACDAKARAAPLVVRKERRPRKRVTKLPAPKLVIELKRSRTRRVCACCE